MIVLQLHIVAHNVGILTTVYLEKPVGGHLGEGCGEAQAKQKEGNNPFHHEGVLFLVHFQGTNIQDFFETAKLSSGDLSPCNAVPFATFRNAQNVYFFSSRWNNVCLDGIKTLPLPRFKL